MGEKRSWRPDLGRPDGYLLLVFCGLQVLLWTVIPGLTHPNPPLDVVEGYAWGRQLQWGYFKHPPLPTVLLELTYRATGLASWSAYFLSQLCIALTYLAVWLLARRITTPGWAALGTLLLAGLLYFQFPTPEFNHNVAQMPIWAWSFYLLHRCWREETAWPWFALASVLALGLYTKYSVALLPLAAFAFFLADPLGRRRLAGWRPWAALLLTLLLFLPHLHWLAQHDFLPLDYARARGGETGGFLARLTAPLGFAFNELLDHLGLLLALGLLFWPWGRKEAAAGRFSLRVEDRRFLVFLGLGPLLLVMLLALVLGFKPKPAWGAPLFALSGLLALALARPRADPLRVKASVAFLGGLTLLLACGFGLYHLFGPELRGRAAKSNFPGPEIAAKLDEAWRAELSGEPLLIAGPIWEAGNVALNLPNRPPVLIEGDLRFSPWVTEEDLRRGPFLLVWKEGHRRVALPPVLGGLTPLAEGQVDARYRNAERLDPLRLNYAIFAPERLAEVSSSSGDRAKAGPEN